MMAGYRPKSLDELNNMYDKTITAEKAIKRATSLVEKSTESLIAANLTEDIQQDTDEVKPSAVISDEINDFIAKFAYDKPSEEKTEKPKPQMTVLVAEQPKAEKSDFELFDGPTEAEEQPSVTEREQHKADRSDIMEEYMRIMNDEEEDEEDEAPHKKLSRKEKKKLRMMEKREAEKEAQESVSEITPDIITEPDSEKEPEEGSSPSFKVVFEDSSSEQEAEEPYEEKISQPQYDIISEDAEESTVQPVAEASGEFEFPENYTPAWMNEEGKEETAEEEKKEKKESKSSKEKKPSNHTVPKVFLSLILVLLVFVGACATVFKTVVPVNTGKAMNDSFYFFTAYKNYADLGIYEGDLVITEKSYAEDGDVFAYIDYNERSFEFGKRSDSITKDDGAVLLVTEKDGSRTLVSRDDCKGVLYAVYPTVGKFIGILSDNFVVVISAAAFLSLVIILVLSLALKSKDTKKKSKKDNAPPSSDDIETEEVDLFATIE